MEPIEERAAGTSGAWRQPRARAALTMLALAAAAAVISYGDGLFLVRRAGATGHVDYLYPLLPDGLIVICLIAIYDAARANARRPGWATAGVILGALLTIAQNLAAGLLHTWALALIDALVPVVFGVSAEVLNGHIRRGRAAPFPMITGGGPVTSGQCPHTVGLTVADAARQAFEHLRDCEAEPVTKVDLGTRFGMSRRQVDALFAPPQDPPAGTPPSLVPAGALNGQPASG